MANIEHTARRDLTFNKWHRDRFDDDASAFDVDLIGMCKSCNNHLYVIEATRSTVKNYSWTALTAVRLNVPGFLVTYSSIAENVPYDKLVDNIKTFTAVQISPEHRLIGGESDFQQHLLSIRRSHAFLWHGIIT